MNYKELFHTEELENITEDIVFEQLHLLLESREVEIPKSEGCVQDIAAITLNRLPAKYAVSFIDKVNPRTDRLDDLLELEKKRKENFCAPSKLFAIIHTIARRLFRKEVALRPSASAAHKKNDVEVEQPPHRFLRNTRRTGRELEWCEDFLKY